MNRASTTKVSDCERWLRWALADGPLPSATLRRAIRANGWGHKTYETAKTRAHVISQRTGFGPGGTWTVRLQRDTRPATGNIVATRCDTCGTQLPLPADQLPRWCIATDGCHGHHRVTSA